MAVEPMLVHFNDTKQPSCTLDKVVDETAHILNVARQRFEALCQSFMPFNQSVKPLVNVHIAISSSAKLNPD